MATPCSTPVCSCTICDRHIENEAVLEALKNCDDDTYEAVISVLIEAGLLPK